MYTTGVPLYISLEKIYITVYKSLIQGVSYTCVVVKAVGMKTEKRIMIGGSCPVSLFSLCMCVVVVVLWVCLTRTFQEQEEDRRHGG